MCIELIAWITFDLNDETETGFGTTRSTHGSIFEQPMDVPYYLQSSLSQQVSTCLSKLKA